MAEHHLHHAREVLVEQPHHLGALQPLGQRGEAADVGEEQCHLAVLALGAARAHLDDAAGDLGREVAAQARAVRLFLGDLEHQAVHLPPGEAGHRRREAEHQGDCWQRQGHGMARPMGECRLQAHAEQGGQHHPSPGNR